jgi:hypothetical protein
MLFFRANNEESIGGILKRISFVLLLALMVFISACQGSPEVDQTQISPTIEPSVASPTENETSEPIVMEMPTTTAMATDIPVTEVIVTTELDLVDGDTTQINALLSNPGADGLISLREALDAANRTDGPNRIGFSPELSGMTIVLGQAQQYEEPRLYVTKDEITVDGDTDGDGVGDITLDGTALDSNCSSAFVLNASHVTVENLNFVGFQKFALMVCCVDDHCAERTYEQITIRNNTITSMVGGGGIVLTPLKLVAYTKDPTLFSNVTMTEIQIMRNRITVSNGGNGGIFIAAAGAGGSDNTLADLQIRDNSISSPGATITINGGDGSSVYFGFAGEEIFSDRNLVENVLISGNTLDPVGIGGDGSRPSGIVLIAGNYGNSDNVLRHIVISENEVTENAEYFTYINPTSNGVVGGLPLTTRAATGNVIENVELADNISHATSAAFTLLASFGTAPAPIGATGRITDVWIHDNQVLDYKWEGIDIFAGVGESESLIEDVVIENNIFTAFDITKGQALFIYAGGCSGCERASDNNQILNLTIRDNILNGNDFIFMYAGMEDFATNNTIEYFLGENDLNPEDATVDIVDFCGKENIGNLIETLEQMP